MNILAFDTATAASTCALLCDETITMRHEVIPRRHTELILPMADALLAEVGLTPLQLDAVAFGRGPGSFTGLRIACGVAQGIGLAADIPVVPVSTLAIVAQTVYQQQQQSRVCVALDARMNEVYSGFYCLNEHSLMQLEGEESVHAVADMAIPSGDWYGAGDGWSEYTAMLQTRLSQQLLGFNANALPHADAMLSLARAALGHGQVVDAADAMPIYLRNKVV